MQHPVISFIGAGNMGGALIAGLLKNGHPADHIWCCDPNAERLHELEKTFDVRITTDQHAAINNADVVILAVKPQIMSSVCKGLASGVATRQPLIISIAAGITLIHLQTWLGAATRIIRAMPNTPALIGAGATAIFANTTATKADQQIAEHLFDTVGICVHVKKESDLDTVTALSGSGPAYFFLMLEALENAASELGLANDISHQLAVQTGLGACLMAKLAAIPITKLRENVTSPGGTTEKAIETLENSHFRELFTKTLAAAKQRARELAEQFGEKQT